jgi:mRNA interferase MazF
MGDWKTDRQRGVLMKYIPEQGDIILLEFDSQAGHEQKGKRPAFVMSNNTFNQFTKIAMVCPIMNTHKGYPLHVLLDESMKTIGVIMCEQAKSLDITARYTSFLEKAPDYIL